jgi:hypothetical protein
MRSDWSDTDAITRALRARPETRSTSRSTLSVRFDGRKCEMLSDHDPDGELETGRMYRIRFIKPGGRIELESQMKLFAIAGDTLFFSARPRFGTQDIKRSSLTSIVPVSGPEVVYINWDPRKPGRPESWRYER